MPEKTNPPKPDKSRETGEKSERLAAALRANLARRKARARALKAAGQGDAQQG